MTVDTSEKDFEAAIEIALAGPLDRVGEEGAAYSVGGAKQDYLRRRPDQYDRTRCLIPDDVVGFLLATQAKTWEKLKQQHGDQVKERFLARLVKEIESRGTLDVLRKGVIDLGCKFDLAYFRPETGLNEEHRRLYDANLLSIVRQCKYSLKNENSLDMALFVNGLPVLTAELKNPLKGQTVENAVAQYRHDRDPKEPLFAFGRCLAHFAVDTDLVYMTTHLRGVKTRFLPFNKGYKEGAGNPPNPHGFSTAYLWEQVWQRDSLLEILNHFLVRCKKLDENGKETAEWELIFPRYHQLDAVRRMVGHARSNGAGQNYLIQHSAGSGKSNSIAWLAHRLAGLHNAEDKRVFDTIIVITDRRVLDAQLRQTIHSFAQVRGVVKSIENNKSQELAKALGEGKDIIVTTLQTFPFITDKIGTLPGKTFAVVIDEAHSSQSGETNRSLKETLSANSLEEAEKQDDTEGVDEEDAINESIERAMRKRGRLENVSFFGFTATPKQKTLELFGQKQPDGSYREFSLYSMRQAIEEKFILDVLKNYTTSKAYFSLLKRVEDDPAYERKKATAILRAYADLHEHAIRTKTEIIVEHFHSQVRSRIDGQARAMVVTRSRLHAVRYKQAFDKYLKEQGYPHKALVAFSGEVTDPDTGVTFTEAGMNGVADTQTAATFKQSDYKFLIVAEKFQTGFDQPLLHTMYVDKKLMGVNAVQTLSRLNRTHPDKEETFVLDFANDADAILKEFQPYYQATILTEGTDPNKLYDLKLALEEYHLFTKSEVEAFAQIYFSPKGKQEQLQPILNPIVEAYQERGGEEQTAFRKQVGNYVRLYAFLSQILTFTDADLEKLYQFARSLLRKLPLSREERPTSITDAINMDSYRIQQTSSGEIKLAKEDGTLEPISGLGTGQEKELELAPLSQIIQYINDNFGADFTDGDKVGYFAHDMQRRLSDTEALKRALDPTINPSDATRKLAFDGFFSDILEDMIDANFDIYKKLKDDDTFASLFRAAIFKQVVEKVKASV